LHNDPFTTSEEQFSGFNIYQSSTGQVRHWNMEQGAQEGWRIITTDCTYSVQLTRKIHIEYQENKEASFFVELRIPTLYSSSIPSLLLYSTLQ
jgi:hypothetical protein